ncbi:MAG: Prepilin leader peptidase/N-methyltransferase [Patescibacteria group bacterium]|nr:Prepilin leader peptidase/N-methyltransferase [Patescibacteria group bacterium]
MVFTFFLVPAFLFIFGAAIGSFLNVIIYRSSIGESWVNGRSHCEKCKKVIAWYDNIPLLSYFILGGKCRNCKTPLSLSHPVVESLTGILFVWWYFAGFLFFKLSQLPFIFLQPLFWLAVGIILLMIVIIDLREMIIPDTGVALLFVLVIMYRLGLTASGVMKTNDLYLSLLSMIGAGLFFFLIWFLTKGKGIGFGDVKLAFPLGLLLGWPLTIVWIFSSFIIGAVFGIGLLLSHKVKMKQAIPFGPFLVAGTLVSLIWGDQLFHWYVTLIR